MVLTENRKWAIGTGISVLALLVSFASWYLSRTPQKAQLVLTKEPGQISELHSSSPNEPLQSLSVYEYRVTIENVGNGNAQDVLLMCGGERDRARGALGVIKAGTKKTADIHFPDWKNDPITASASTCEGFLVVSYSDDSGKQAVSFDPSGQANPFHLSF